MHPTQKPYGLMRDLIVTHTKEGDVVLDPFAGSGVVGRACKDMDREAILIEVDKKYYELIKQL